MKAFKVFMKVLAVCAVVAGILFLVAAYWDKLTALFARRGELKAKIPTVQQIREKLPTKQAIFSKFPSKDELIRLNPFRKAEIEAEFADYADVE